MTQNNFRFGRSLMSRVSCRARRNGLAVLAGACAAFAATSAHAATIAAVEAEPTGTAVTLDNNPVISYVVALAGQTGDGYTYTNNVFLANDGTGSVDVFGHLPAGSTYVPTVGDEITVSGTFSPFNGIPELSGMTAIAQTDFGDPVPNPTTVTITQLNAVSTTENLGIEAYEVELDNVTFSGLTAGQAYPVHANFSYTVTDGTNSLVVFFNPSTYAASGYLGGQTIPTGPVDITGIIDSFGGNYYGSPVGGTPELIPFSITAVPEPASMSLVALTGVALLGRRRRSLVRS